LCSGSVVTMVPAEGGCFVISGRRSASEAAVSEAGAGISFVVEKVFQLGAECCHLAREVLDPLHKSVVVGEWPDVRQRWVGCSLRDAVCTESCCIQVALGLASKNGPCVGG
jgi:hypothetical protein